jgi:penicillin-insensitive murein endopeptidase
MKTVSAFDVPDSVRLLTIGRSFTPGPKPLTLSFMLFLVIIALHLTGSSDTFAANPWGAQRSPASGPAESIGTPTAGCLKGGIALNTSVPGVVLTRPERHRYYGHPRLVELLSSVGSSRAQKSLAPLFLGDVAQARGGPTMSAHASHQTGLDADILYAVPAKWNYKAKKQRAPAAPGMVDTRKKKVTASFGPAQVALLKSFAEQDQIDRVLVHYAIKKELCERAPKEAWIRKIRPWYGHDHHFHIRVKCAASDQKCKDGEPIPSGNGCDETLAWWWSNEATGEAQKNQHRQTHPVMPELPAECGSLIGTRVAGGR